MTEADSSSVFYVQQTLELIGSSVVLGDDDLAVMEGREEKLPVSIGLTEAMTVTVYLRCLFDL